MKDLIIEEIDRMIDDCDVEKLRDIYEGNHEVWEDVVVGQKLILEDLKDWINKNFNEE